MPRRWFSRIVTTDSHDALRFTGSCTLPCDDQVAKLSNMLKHLSIAVALTLAVGCKTDEPAKAKSTPAAEKSSSARSANVKPVTPRPQLPANMPEIPAGQTAATEPAVDDLAHQTHFPVVQTEVPTTDNPPLRDEDEIRGRNVWRKRRRFDANHDGKVTPEELAAVSQRRVEAAHARMDLDGDGKLTADELASTNTRMRFDDGEKLDVNRDGNISPDELSAGLRARREQRAAEAAKNEPQSTDNAETLSTP
jgi:hypothetical protein